MKEVMAVIRINKMNQTKKALAEAGVPAFVANEAMGRGKGLISAEVLKGAAEGHEEAVDALSTKGRLFAKRVLSVVVHDDEVEKVVKALVDVNKTGQAGDGKIFVIPLLDSIRVRTGEVGEKSLD